MKNNDPRPSIYGFHAVREAWLNPSRRIQALYIADTAEKGFEPVLQQAKKANLRRPAPQKLDKNRLERLLPRGAVHQGLALAAEPLEETGIRDFVIKASAKDKSVILMLDQVTDPHNVGAILRSAAAFGADGIVLQRKHAPELTLALAKTASGAAEHIPVAYETNLSRALEELKEGGYFVYGFDERGDTDLHRITNKGGKSVIVLGAEGEGMRRLIRENCDVLVRLPTQGPIASLNVSNAAAVALYAFCAD